ncbi:MAG: hypothetical protein WBH01_02780 [Dehalococcoidia bacterium]
MSEEQYQVWCDKPSDKALVQAFGRISEFWASVSDIQVIPNLEPDSLFSNFATRPIAPLLEYDRPDIIVLLDGKPVLVIEITEHGYTGDNPLQRFARVVRAAEMKVPLVHFTPFARTRFDEMLYTDSLTSARRVSSRLFEGFAKLTDIYCVPIVAMDWPVTPRGIPIKPDLKLPAQLREIFGELVAYSEHLCRHDGPRLISGENILNCEVIRDAVEATKKKARQTNVLDSEIRIQGLSYETVYNIIANPNTLVRLLGEGYFMKGKDHKLIALRAINESAIDSLETKIGVIPRPDDIVGIKGILPAEFNHKPWLLFYSGYEWRGQPNGGIVTNTDILYCRTANGSTVKDRDQYLAVVWPRVFYEMGHQRRSSLLQELIDFVNSSKRTRLGELIEQKRDLQGLSLDHPNYIAYNRKSIGAWTEKSTISRIYRHFCDLVILNDRVLLGDHWK